MRQLDGTMNSKKEKAWLFHLKALQEFHLWIRTKSIQIHYTDKECSPFLLHLEEGAGTNKLKRHPLPPPSLLARSKISQMISYNVSLHQTNYLHQIKLVAIHTAGGS